MAKQEKTWWSQAELARYLGIERSSIRYYLAKGAPKRVDKKFDVEEFCKFLVMMPVKGSQKSPAKEQAQKFLVNLGLDIPMAVKPDKPIPPPMAPPKPKPLQPKSMPITTLNEKEVLGMVAALARARQAEYDAHQIYQKALDETHIISAISLDVWQKTLEILRKCEADFMKTMERQRLLVEKSAVQTYIETMIEQVKQTMLNLPSKMAPSLDGLPWQDIQQRLDIEIRDILDGLSNYE